MRADGKHHTLKDLYHERTNFDFLHRRWRWALLSGLVLLAGLVGFIAHSGLVTTDVGVALFMFGTMYFLWRIML